MLVINGMKSLCFSCFETAPISRRHFKQEKKQLMEVIKKQQLFFGKGFQFDWVETIFLLQIDSWPQQDLKLENLNYFLAVYKCF